MAKFCSKCGNELNDTAKFCGKCGKSCMVTDVQSSMDDIVKNENFQEKEGGINKIFNILKNKKMVRILAILLVVFFAICSIIPIMSRGGSYSYNVEAGPGEMGARFNMNLEEFTNEFNKVCEEEIIDYSNWEFYRSGPETGGDVVLDSYFQMIAQVQIMVAVEHNTGKIYSMSISSEAENSSTITGLMRYFFAALTHTDVDEGNRVVNKVIEEMKEGKRYIHKNVMVSFVAPNDSFMGSISAVSNEKLEDAKNVVIE